MKGIIVNRKVSEEVKYSAGEILLKFFLFPVRSGLYGFAAFFTVLVAAKFFWYMLGYKDWFTVTTDDVKLSVLGFAIIFLVRFIQNFKPAER